MGQTEIPCSRGAVVSDCGRSAEFATWITLSSGEFGIILNKCGPCSEEWIKRFADDEERTVNRVPLI